MEKLEWRGAFQRQPAYYLFLDMTAPMSVHNLKTICQVLQDLIALSVSLKGTQRFSVLGIYALSDRTKCIFPMQSIKNNYAKFQFSIECIQSIASLFNGKKTFDNEQLTESLQTAIQQYEAYYQGAVQDKEEWPQLQLIFFSAQFAQKFVKDVEESLTAIELAYIRQINVVILRGRYLTSSFNSSESTTDIQVPGSQGIFDNEEKENIIRSILHVMEIEANSYQLESIFKNWLHDCGTDSDHLRLTIDKMVLRCDIKERLLNADSLPTTSQFFLFPNSNLPQPTARVNPSSKQLCITKVPVYTMEAVSVIRREGLCESLIFGHPFVAIATRCWKIDWDELERNEQQFTAIVEYLCKNNLVLLAKRQSSQFPSAEKALPAGHFAFFPAKNTLLVKSVASKELVMPLGEMQAKEIPEEVKMEIFQSLKNLEEKDFYNPLAVSSGLYDYLTSSLSKISKSRPSTNFVVPIINREEEPAKKKKKCAVLPISETQTKKSRESSFKTDFLSASALFKKRFPNNLE
ncbi:meiosis 1 arrest protein [Caerostris darwini]|uniref:Meiosis 1 arrest protein n=1 Tax=Caerostris darwini TaxID=1538125 RepID=A0AAV4NYH4_9ARAC|nr:meiosis 1 arrest protein [Caerostris darwini]